MPDQTPRTLEGVRAIRDQRQRLVAVVAYLAQLHDREAEAMRLRDDLLRAIDAGPTELARLTGLSLSTVKLARRNPR